MGNVRMPLPSWHPVSLLCEVAGATSGNSPFLQRLLQRLFRHPAVRPPGQVLLVAPHARVSAP